MCVIVFAEDVSIQRNVRSEIGSFDFLTWVAGCLESEERMYKYRFLFSE